MTEREEPLIISENEEDNYVKENDHHWTFIRT